MTYLALLGAALLQTTLASSGRWLFAVAAGVAVVNLIKRVRRRDPLPSLATMWELGFILIIVGEGFFEETELVSGSDLSSYRLATAFLVGGFAATMVGHAVTYRAARYEEQAGLLTHKTSWRQSRAFVVALVVFFAAVSGPGALTLASGGRLGAAVEVLPVSAFGSLLYGMARGAAIVLPAMIAYHVLLVRRGSVQSAYLLAAPILFVNFAMGTRFVFLISAVGIVGVHLLSVSVTRGQLLKIAAVGVVLALAMSFMMQFRNEGVVNASPGELLANTTSSSSDLISGDGVVRVVSELVIYFNRNPHLLGKSTLGWAIFWVPRQFWPSKPTLLGYWFPRAYGGTAGFSVGHSISAGFGGDAYADFGFWGGLVLLLGFGLALGALDRWASRILAVPDDPWVIFVATLFGFVFFAVRSPLTSTTVAVGVLVWVVGYRWSLRQTSGDDRSPAPTHAAVHE